MSPMTFRMWRGWVRSLPWSLRWFVVLVLVRPMLDVLFFLKEISPLLSPLYIVGVLTPLLILASFTKHRLRHFGFEDGLMLVLAGLLLLNSIIVLTLEVSYLAFETVLKLLMPALLFFFLRVFMTSRVHLIGLLTTFLYSCLFPLGMLMYETFVGALSGVIVTRGFERLEGLYADVMSYAIYVVGALVIVCYFYVEERFGETLERKGVRLFVVAAVCVIGLISMHHTASWIVAGAVIGLLAFHGLGMRQTMPLFFVVAMAVGGYLALGESIGARLSTAFSTDIAVLEGQKDLDRAFHGRMWRWRQYVGEWQESNAIAKVIGVTVGADELPASYLLSGVHNDYLRIAFSTGVVGLILYLMFHISILLKSFRYSVAEGFLLRASSAVLLLYSVTTTPTLYVPLLYLLFAVLAYGSRGGYAMPVRVRQAAGGRAVRRSHRDGEPAVTA